MEYNPKGFVRYDQDHYVKTTPKHGSAVPSRSADSGPIKVNRDMEYFWLKLGFFQLLN